MPLRRGTHPSLATSLLLHSLAVALMVLAMRHAGGKLLPLRLPGTRQGTHMMLTYSLGGPAESKLSAVARSEARQRVAQKVVKTVLPASSAKPSAPESERGTGSAGSSAFGDEDVHVALPQIHPRPQPDLSGLPHGTAGDVVVDVVIDDAGRVTGATLVRGLGSMIDSSVVQALRTWTFTPATRNGQNVASEQEILIHYERA